MKTFVSLAVSATMFPLSGTIEMSTLTPEEVKSLLHSHAIESALNPSHSSTIDVIRRRYGIDLPIPERAPKVALESGDQLIIVQANLPRLAEGESHSQETVLQAPISFRLWKVVA